MRYFIDIAGDWFTCTSNLEPNEFGEYEFHWESDFQSGVQLYEKLEGNVVEITEKEYELILMTLQNEELINYQHDIKEMIVKSKSSN